jgi:putative ABC transport system permease protein
MFTTTLKTLLARRFGLVTTAFAVLLGVAFMAGTMTLTHAVSSTFDGVYANAYAGTAAYVRSASTTGPSANPVRGSIPASTLNTVNQVDGVSAATGVIQGYAQLLSKTDTNVGSKSAPTLGLNWIADPKLNAFRIVEGTPPAADDQIVIDRASAKDAGYHIGDRAPVLTAAGPQRLRIVGIAAFGTADTIASAHEVLFTTPAAQRLVGQRAHFDAVSVRARSGVTQAQLAQRIRQVLPASFQVLTGAQLTSESQRQAHQMLAGFSDFLLAFALIALFVGSFVIYNTFSILVAQRSREHALLRAIGASRRQILVSVIIESLAVGAIAVVAGIAAGFAMAAALKTLFESTLGRVPTGHLVLTSSTVAACTAVGLGITLFAAVLPARRAAQVPPVAAMREATLDPPLRGRGRTVRGTVATGAGAAIIGAGLFGHVHNAIRYVGVGGVVLFIGVAMLAPLLARPAGRILGAPGAMLGGVAGQLGRGNAMRNPRRTSATAASLMIGVALVGFLTVFATSAKRSYSASVSTSVNSAFVITAGAVDQGGGFQSSLVQAVDRVPGVRVAAGYRTTTAEIGTSSETVAGVDSASYPQIVNLGVTHGTLADLGDHGIAVVDTLAASRHWTLGQTIAVRFAATGVRPLRLVAIYTQKVQVAPLVVGQAVYQANVVNQLDSTIYVATDRHASNAAVRAGLASASSAYPTATIETRGQYVKDQLGAINTLLGLVYALLLFAVLVALMGISNTMALSVHERTRELGLLRAVGISRRQLRSAVRHEAAIVASFGTMLGLTIGVGFGYALVKAAHNSGIGHFTIPVAQLGLIAAIAITAGIVAASLPARRAARLDILDAIATQ